MTGIEKAIVARKAIRLRIMPIIALLVIIHQQILKHLINPRIVQMPSHAVNRSVPTRTCHIEISRHRHRDVQHHFIHIRVAITFRRVGMKRQLQHFRCCRVPSHRIIHLQLAIHTVILKQIQIIGHLRRGIRAHLKYHRKSAISTAGIPQITRRHTRQPLDGERIFCGKFLA